MTDVCKGCGSERPKRRQWYYRYPDLPGGGRAVRPIAAWCPTCAPPDMVAARTQRKLDNLARRRAS